MKHEGETFEGMTVRMDGGVFIDCTFNNCTIEFAGTGEMTHMMGNTFNDCPVHLIERAANTISFVSHIYHRYPPGLRDLWLASLLQQAAQMGVTAPAGKMN